MKESKEELYLHDFIEWLRDHSHEVGYWRLVYLYSDEGVEAKRLLNRLMFLDCKTEWGWMDDYVEYCPASCFAARAKTYRKVIEGGGGKLEPIDPRSARHFDPRGYVKLALTDVQELVDDARDMHAVLDICQRLATRDSAVLLTGNGYPSDVFADYPEMARLLLDGFVIKVDKNQLSFTSGRAVKSFAIPFPDLLLNGPEGKIGRAGECPSRDCEHLLFQWELLCTWKDRYKAFDLDLFKDAFVDAWGLLQTKSSSEDYQYRWRLVVMMSGFSGGLFLYYLSLMTDFGPSGDGVVYGDPYEMAAAQSFTDSFLKSALTQNLSRVDKTVKLSKVVRRDEHDYWKPEWWQYKLSLFNFSKAIDDFARTIREVKTSDPCSS